MSERSKIRAQELQAQRDAEVRRELASKKAKEAMTAKEAEDRRKRLDEAAAEARRKELKAANAALMASAPAAPSAKVMSARTVEYDPFAEDEVGPSSVAGPSKPRKLNVGGRSGDTSANGSSQRERSNGGGGKAASKREREREGTPPMLSRKEKAQRALAMQIKKGKGESLFSIRDLVDRDGKGKSSSPARRSSPPLPPPRSKVPAQKLATKLKGPVHELRKLAPGRANWDTRTTAQIQDDLKAARPRPMASVKAEAPAKTNGAKRPRSASPVKPAASKPKPRPPPIPSSARPPASPPRPTKAGRRPRSPSSSSSASIPDDPDDIAGVSATIQSLFRRPGASRPAPTYADSDASSDMEARLSDVEEEERKAARIARREDEIAEREERERKAQKEKLKRQRV